MDLLMNYPTWAVKIWLSDNYASDNLVLIRIINQAKTPERLGDLLRDYIDQVVDLQDNPLANDLLAYALGEIDFSYLGRFFWYTKLILIRMIKTNGSSALAR